MNEILRSIFNSRTVITEDGLNSRPLIDNIPEDEGDFVQTLIRRTQPSISLEVGCAYGISSLFICEALREVNAAKHIIIDPYQYDIFEGIGLANLRRAGYDDIIEFHEIVSYQYLARLTEERVRIDFAFIDGQHTFDYVLVDFFLIDKLLRTGGIIVFDDLTHPSVRSVCRYVLLNLRYKCVGPLPSPIPALRKLAAGVSANTPLRRIVKPTVSVPNEQLNLPSSRYVALQKEDDDLIGEGQGATRHHSTHIPF
jgi:predicted O-methyltransferase YrrM